MGIPRVSLDVDSKVDIDSRNLGLINSMITQNIDNSFNIGSFSYAGMCLILLIGAIFTLYFYRQLKNHGNAISAQRQVLQHLVARNLENEQAGQEVA